MSQAIIEKPNSNVLVHTFTSGLANADKKSAAVLLKNTLKMVFLIRKQKEFYQSRH